MYYLLGYCIAFLYKKIPPSKKKKKKQTKPKQTPKQTKPKINQQNKTKKKSKSGMGFSVVSVFISLL